MAIPFLNNINLSDNQLQNAKLHITSTAPTAAAAQIYFDSTADLVANPPTYDLTAKYYSNTTDLWVSLKEYSFPTGNYVTGAVTGTTPKPIITFDLNATDGDAAETSEGNGIRYLSKNNKWALVSEIPGTYAWTISDNAVSAVTAGVASGDTLQIAASSDLTSALTLAGEADITKVLTVGLKVDGGVGVENNYIVNQVSAIAAADDTIPFNDYTDEGTPATSTNVVKKTTFGTIPIDALTEVKQYIDDSVAGGLIYQGGFDGSTGFVTGTSNYLDNRGTQIAVNKGWTYTVTTAGTFYGEVVEVGDVLIAEDDLASGTGALTDWTTVQNNIDLASLTQIGIGNVNAGTGIDVVYSGGTATVSLADAAARSGSIAIPTSDTYTYPNSITAGATNDVLIQLVDSGTGETVYADVTRISETTFSVNYGVTTPTDVIALIQLIG